MSILHRLSELWKTVLGIDEVRISENSPTFLPPNMNSLLEIGSAEEEYNKQPVIIEGVVSPKGQGALLRRKKGYSLCILEFTSWRKYKEPIKEKPLSVYRAASIDAGLGDYFPSYSPQRISVYLSKCETRCIFINLYHPPRRANDLLSVAEKLLEPVIVESELFGQIHLGRNLNRFGCLAIWNDSEIHVYFSTEDKNILRDCLEVAGSLWSDQVGWNKRIGEYAIEELLNLKNENWLKENEEPISSEEFLSKMTLESITISPDGEFEFSHHDGELFWDHLIQIDGNLEEGLNYANIAG